MSYVELELAFIFFLCFFRFLPQIRQFSIREVTCSLKEPLHNDWLPLVLHLELPLLLYPLKFDVFLHQIDKLLVYCNVGRDGLIPVVIGPSNSLLLADFDAAKLVHAYVAEPVAWIVAVGFYEVIVILFA